MSKYAINGAGFSFNTRDIDTLVYYGDDLLCQAFRMRNHWSVVVHGDELKGLRRVDGFKTRWDCIMYSLRVRGYVED